ncbi:MAG: hypothetical protein QOI31_2619 [Solirubrobacterales bacterium]|jgi:Tfp pilus assembly protein PilX|nr:hypothetical protein [Solirubrobacterales bacterium]
MRLIRTILRCGRSESGFTMGATILGGAVMGLVVVTAVTAARGELNVTRADLDQKQAYEAARAGIADYAYHLNQDTNYWTRCANVPTPTAVNQVGSTARRRSVPGTTGAAYAIELIPRTGQAQCTEADPVNTMIEQSGSSVGTFRIRSTGYSQDSEVSLVATFKRASFLDFLYFTQLETSDPVTYGNQATINGAYQQCTKTIAEGRYDQNIPGSSPTQACDFIYFVGGEHIDGPLHTNDAFLVCNGQPIFGRTPTDIVSVSAPPPGWFGCSGSSPNFLGTFVTNAPVLTPPPTNASLRTVAAPSYRYTGQTRIVLSGNTFTVNGGMTQPIPSNGVIYVSNGACSAAYNPFTAVYPNTSTCGNVYVRGNYSGRLTIAAENDVIVDGNLVRSGNGMLGLIANNFVRVFHPFANPASSLTTTTQTSRSSCGSGANGTNSVNNLRIDAAILSIQHSFIVDHYSCGVPLGNLTVNGAIAQRFRGAVGTFSQATGNAVSGYSKRYTYDDRLRYISPPHFLDPVESAWHVQRETVE